MCQELVSYTIAIQDRDRGRQPPRWAQATARSWLPQPLLPQLGPPQQPGPPRLMAAGQGPFQVPFTPDNNDFCSAEPHAVCMCSSKGMIYKLHPIGSSTRNCCKGCAGTTCVLQMGFKHFQVRR